MLVASKVKMSGSAKKSEQDYKQQNVIFNTLTIFEFPITHSVCPPNFA